MSDTHSPRAEWSDDNRSIRESDDNHSNAPDNVEQQARRNPPEPNEHLVTQLYEELRVVVQAHNKFEQFDLTRVWDTAVLLVRYGIPSLESFRTTDDQARKYLFEDFRKAEKLSFAEIALVLKLNRHIPPHDQKTSEKNIRYTELDIPRALTSFRPNLSCISAAFQPEQEMVNWINKQRAIAASKDPPYVPYLAPKLTEPPWMLPTTEHQSARTGWVAYSRQARRQASPQELSIQCFSLYHMRFLLSAELCNAFEPFGGIAHQLSHLSTVLNLSIVESVGVALAYHRIIVTKLQERARQRSAKLSDFTELLKSEDFSAKEQAKREITSAVEKDKKELAAHKEAQARLRNPVSKATLRPRRETTHQRDVNNQRDANVQRSRSRSPRRLNYDNLPSNNLPQNQRFARNVPHYGANSRPNLAPQRQGRQQQRC